MGRKAIILVLQTVLLQNKFTLKYLKLRIHLLRHRIRIVKFFLSQDSELKLHCYCQLSAGQPFMRKLNFINFELNAMLIKFVLTMHWRM